MPRLGIILEDFFSWNISTTFADYLSRTRTLVIYFFLHKDKYNYIYSFFLLAILLFILLNFFILFTYIHIFFFLIVQTYRRVWTVHLWILHEGHLFLYIKYATVPLVNINFVFQVLITRMVTSMLAYTCDNSWYRLFRLLYE